MGEIPEEAVAAAAGALWEFDHAFETWEYALARVPVFAGLHRDKAVRALRAALPHLSAALAEER